MPTDCNQQRNEFSLPHGGTAQTARSPLALQPSYVKVDERTLADWIVFARDYARFLQYYNLADAPDGDWTPFWTANPALVLANLAAAPVDAFREATRQIFIELQKLDNQTNDLLLQQHFNLLFDWITTLALQLDQHIQRLPDDLPVKQSLRNRIAKKLAPSLRKWLAWHKAAAAASGGLFPLIDPGQGELSEPLRQQRILGSVPITTQEVYDAPPRNRQFSEDWLLDGATDWTTYSGTDIVADATIFGDTASMTSVSEPISFALRHFFFTSVYEQFLQAFASTAGEATKALQQLLKKWNRHEPHFALFLAFLRLLQKEQAYLNTLTDRHLRFYYERVLRLQPRPPRPAHAHVLVELAKAVDSYLLPKATQLKAGKDATGREVFFATDEDFVANKARVAELRSIFKAPANPAEYRLGDPERPVFKNSDRNRYFAAPVANSADGLGEEELTTPDGRWHPFGNRSVDATDNTWTVGMPRAELGFALASHYLYLTQGTRTATVKFAGDNVASLLGKTFRILLTTEEGWYERHLTVTQNDDDNRYQLQWTLSPDEPAILPYQPAVHGGNFATDWPVMQAFLDDTPSGAYQEIKQVRLTGLTISVDVTGKRNMAVSGSTGPLDISKPFHPFGVAPETGAVFFVGDKEVFQKAADAVLHVEWKEYDGYRFFDPHTHNQHPSTLAAILETGNWTDLANSNLVVHAAPARDTLAFSINDDRRIAPAFGPNTPYGVAAGAGYIRVQLQGDWGHAEYPMALTKYIAKGGAEPGRVYDPQLVDLYLNYEATTTVSLTSPPAAQAAARLYHLHPFGQAPALPEGGRTRLLPLLVPQYSIDTPDGPLTTVGKDGGEWLIGIEDLRPPQVLSLLVQVANGSADPLLAKPADHVRWSYLSNNQWQDFAADAISDGTQGLLQSGLIRFSVPREATSDNTLLPAGRHWIRANVPQAVDAVGQLIGVHAQGVAATLVDNANDPQLSALPLPAGTIAKLRQPVNAVKKITQPYATFGGAAAETPARFYTRISERLRHKQRAITHWDYERLVLEHFPQVHKIKCLNHLRYEPNATTPIYRELAPGHVTLIAVSNLRKQSAVDALRPYTSLATLQSIDTFLRERMSCQARLHVRNPVFEPVKAVFRVRFFPGYDPTFYENLLNEAIIRYLSPWAFEEGRDIEFGGKFYLAPLVNFVEEQPYVDYVDAFTLHHEADPSQRGLEVIRPTSLVAILVAARRHDITVIDLAPAAEWNEACGCEAPTTAISATPNLTDRNR